MIETKAGSAGPWTTVNDGVSSETFGVALGLLGTEHFFRVAAVNSVGMGPWSNELSGVPYSFDPAPADANGNQGTRFLYWYKTTNNQPNNPPGNTYYQLGVLVNGNVEATNISVSTASINNTMQATLTVLKDSSASGTLNCTDTYDFYVRVIDTSFFGATVVTDWITHPEWENYSYSNTFACL